MTGRTPFHLLVTSFLLLTCGLALADVEVRMAQTGDPYATMAKLIAKAEVTLDVAIYGINSEPDVAQALGKAAKRGVRVRLILDPKNHQRRDQVAGDLEKMKVDVRLADRTQHQKFVIIDGETVAAGSGNWTNASIDREYEDNYVIFRKDKGVVAAFQAEWARLYENSEDIPGPGAHATEADDTVPDLDPEPVVPESCEVYFTSLNEGRETTIVADRIKKGLLKAKTSIHIMMAFMAHDGLTKDLIRIHKKHNENDDPSDDIDIRVVLDQYQYIDTTSTAKQLEEAGIPVRYKFYSFMHNPARSATLHHKVMIVDGKTVLTGSYNWSETAEWDNYENLMVFNDEDVAEEFEEEHARLYDLNRKSFRPILRAVKAGTSEAGYARYLPIHFDTPYHDATLALTRAEIKDLNEALVKTGIFRRKDNAWRSYYDREKFRAVTDDDSHPEGSFLASPGETPGIVGGLPND